MSESCNIGGDDTSAEQELLTLAKEHPDDFRAFAEKADEPIQSRLLRLLDQTDAEGEDR